MDKIDKIIFEDLSREIILPNSYTNTILNCLNNKENIKKYKYKKLIRTLTTAIASIILCTGVAFAGYTIYEKVWKEPKIYNTYEEKMTDDIYNYEKNNNEKLEENEIVSVEKATTIISNISQKLELNESITEKDIVVNTEVFSNYFEIENDKLRLNINANGIFQNYINKSFDYTAKPDNITEKEATEIANKILENIEMNENYTLKSIESTTSIDKNNSAKIWFASYYQTFNGLSNKYNCINISFNIVNNKVVIERIITLDNGFKFQNNEVIISQEEALDIAKEMDRKISILNISSCDAKLDIERLNSFVYIQEKTLGKEDELKEEIINNSSHIYSGYSNEKILRVIWNVTISYDYNDTNSRNSNEYYGRNYFIDATTGEIIGGSWGKIGY